VSGAGRACTGATPESGGQAGAGASSCAARDLCAVSLPAKNRGAPLYFT
jgi:hypothetical protein